MPLFTNLCNDLFNKAIVDYHLKNNIDTAISDPYDRDSIEYKLYEKCWIDTIQWHLEDLIRDPGINPVKALFLKRRIDISNQERTDIVEDIDTWFLHHYSDIKPLPGARINTESPAWAIDRLSILALKIYHMKEETERADATEEHKAKCLSKLKILEEQRRDLSLAIDQLLEDISEGKKYMKVYKQMKMYNDPSTNPILYEREHTDKKEKH